MANLIDRITNTTVYDLFAASTTLGTWGDSTKTTCIIKSIVICASTAAVVDLRLEASATTSADRYIFDGLVMPAGTTITMDTPIAFDRATYDLMIELGSGDVTIFISYQDNKKKI